ncbi:hypothetical protein ASG51_21115 [Methylobacterium sp. Leaf465]|jgi:hypothetical protein|uniref:hypothetical protein n=1 Tax=Methylobacterium sp. Leaf465 TaxID=1736385 RepID=UPI0006F8EB81|nr:hypothetical protein [Methylobacterium sp. Leaf465]KQT80900.1 hypothetical protein ASG51_21115 [Methylobacterium sp. Leaf465]
MARRVDHRQLGFDFSMPALAMAREIFKTGALPAYPLHVPGSAEEAEAIGAIPFGQRWENYVAVGAVPERIEIHLPRKNRLDLSITGTRLGWTAGHMLMFRRSIGPGANPRAGTGHTGEACGGGLHADVDENGHFLWTSRAAALQAAAHRAWWSCWKLDAKVAAEVERAVLGALGFSPVEAPGHEHRRWLVSRADGYASLERRRSQPHDAIPESPAIDEYRRAAGLSDTRAWRTAA